MSLRLRPLRHEGDLVYVPLSRGMEAVIDAADAPLAREYNWFTLQSRVCLYAVSSLPLRESGKVRKIRMLHRVILGEAAEGMEVDHIDGDGLNCRRANLRTATRTQNICNRRIFKNNTSGFKGVQKVGPNRWDSKIQINRKPIYLGRFDNPEAAYEAYCAAARKHHGDFARLA
jgi:hypothetical protein